MFDRIKERSHFTCLLLHVFASLCMSATHTCYTNLPSLLHSPDRFLIVLPHQPNRILLDPRRPAMLTSSLEDVLVACPIPKALTTALDNMERGRLPFNGPSEGETSRPSSESGEDLLAYLTGLVSRGARGTDCISLLGIKASGKVIHIHSLFCVCAGDYNKPDLWGVLGPLPDEGTPSYIKITPLHLATSYSFLGVSRTKFKSALSGLSIEGEDLEDVAWNPTAEADDGSQRAQGVCFLPSELV